MKTYHLSEDRTVVVASENRYTVTIKKKDTDKFIEFTPNR